MFSGKVTKAKFFITNMMKCSII